MMACGTSYHAGLVGEYLFEELARMPVDVEYASEFRYRNPPDRSTTRSPWPSLRAAKPPTLWQRCVNRNEWGTWPLAVCNVVGSSIARESDGGVYLHAGPEVGVASTKAFTSQTAVLTMLALYFGRTRHLSSLQGARIIAELKALPDAVRECLKCHERVKEIAAKYAHVRNMLFLGRQYLFPAALLKAR